MDNAADAIKMAGFVLLFVAALSLAMFTLSKARAVSAEVINTSNDRSYYSYVEDTDYIKSDTEFITERIVGMDSILPTLYRYYKENYRIEFYDINGEGIGLYTPRGEIDKTNALDIDAEMQNDEYWQGSPQPTKEHIDSIVNDVLLPFYKNGKFTEELGIVETTSDSNLLEDINKQTKRVIRYRRIS